MHSAARYSAEDHDILIEADLDAHGLRLCVTDRGRGLDPSELDHLFERFFRGRHAQDLAPGTGMGLAITRGLLNAIGGHVWVRECARRRREVPDRRSS